LTSGSHGGPWKCFFFFWDVTSDVDTQSTSNTHMTLAHLLLAVRQAYDRPYLSPLVAGFPPQLPGFESILDHVGFVVDKGALDHVSSEYSIYPFHSFHRLLHIIFHHPGQLKEAKWWPAHQVDKILAPPLPQQEN
jgi:hypothetical protein